MPDLLQPILDQLEPIFSQLAELRRALAGGPRLSDPKWIVIARVEDDRSPFAPARRLTAPMLREVAEAYDPRIHRAALITSINGEMPHSMASRSGVAAGYFERLSFDGLNLWGYVRGIIDPVAGISRIDHLVASGHTAVSVNINPKMPPARRLDHVALLPDGHQPGVAGMPTLSDFGFGLAETDVPVARSADWELLELGLEGTFYRVAEQPEETNMPDPVIPEASPPANSPPALDPAALVRSLATVEGQAALRELAPVFRALFVPSEPAPPPPAPVAAVAPAVIDEATISRIVTGALATQRAELEASFARTLAAAAPAAPDPNLATIGELCRSLGMSGPEVDADLRAAAGNPGYAAGRVEVLRSMVSARRGLQGDGSPRGKVIMQEVK